MHTYAHTNRLRSICVASPSLPHCKSLAIPDAGWSAEPGWPETISDPRGGCTSQWAPRPWLKHQLLSMQHWQEERGKKWGGIVISFWWRNWEFSSISCLCSWLKEGFCSLHYEQNSIRRGDWLQLFFTTSNTLISMHMTENYNVVHFHISQTWEAWDINMLTQTYRCTRLHQPVDYCNSNVAISFDICGFDMYLRERRFR